MTDSNSVSRRSFLGAAAATIGLAATGQQASAQKPDQPIALAVFSATWCPPCKVLKGQLETLEPEIKQNPNIKLYRFDFDKMKAGEYGDKAKAGFDSISKSIPAMALVNRQGKIISSHRGIAEAGNIKQWLEAHVSGNAIQPTDPEATKALFDDPSKPSIVVLVNNGDLRDVKYRGLMSGIPDDKASQKNLVVVSVQDVQDGKYAEHDLQDLSVFIVKEAEKKAVILDSKGSIQTVVADPKDQSAFEKLLGVQSPQPAPSLEN